MIVRGASLTAIDFSGLRILDYTAGADGASSLAAIDVPPGVAHATAWSMRSDKYYLVVAGSVDFVLEGRVHALGEGDFCLVRQGQRFSYANTSEVPARLVLVHTPGFELSQEKFE